MEDRVSRGRSILVNAEIREDKWEGLALHSHINGTGHFLLDTDTVVLVLYIFVFPLTFPGL